MRTNQEQTVLNQLICWFNLPITSFYSQSLDSYEVERENTKYGFIGQEVPHVFKGKTYWTDFVIYIPNVIDIRLEVKTLNGRGGLSDLPAAQVSKMKNIPEKELIFLLEGDGFNDEAISLFNDCKPKNTKVLTSIEDLFKEIFINNYNL